MDASGLPGGTVYPALRRLERDGLVSSNWEGTPVAKKAKRPRRRYYEISDRGREDLEGALQRFRLLRQPMQSAANAGQPETT